MDSPITTPALVPTDYFQNGRIVHELGEHLGNEVRITKNKNASIDKLAAALRPLHVSIIAPDTDFPDYMDPLGSGYPVKYKCEDYVFDSIDMPHYSVRDGGALSLRLVHKDFHDIVHIKSPEKGAVVLYFTPIKNNRARVDHWGIIVDINPMIMVRSKWGSGHVFEHPLHVVSEDYGRYVMFFRPENVTS